jgi:non-haem Fe2+, alpha-ketoglutarate-dependent halogenase
MARDTVNISMKLKKRIKTVKKRYIPVLIFAILIVVRYLHIPHKILPKKFQFLLRYWSLPMMKLHVKSLGTRYYMDQPCALAEPSSFEPKASVSDEFKLSEDQIRFFYSNGFLGPFTAITEEEMGELRKLLDEERQKPSTTFGFKTVRDRHFDIPQLLELFSQPAIVERLAQLMGPDLLLWRSQIFNQEPGAPPITWHQATTYMLEDYKRPILEPADPSELFQLTTWIAVDEATVENGCLQFIPGTHQQTRTVKIGGKDGFYATQFQLEFEPDPSQIVSMELKTGQFVIFSERVIHGSPGNNSKRRRLGVNFRTILPSTQVYSGQTHHYAMHLEETYDLANWGVVLLRGEDHYKLNKRANRIKVEKPS